VQSTVEALLEQLIASSTSERDKGDKFERLVRRFLEVDAYWSSRFAQVQMWTDWSGRDQRPDHGIDLVATDRETGQPVAVQCKFYGRDKYLAKPDIDSFLSESGKHPFAGRLIVSTTVGQAAQTALVPAHAFPTVTSLVSRTHAARAAARAARAQTGRLA